MGKRTMTPERMEAIRAALGTMTLREIRKHFRVSDGTLYRYGLRKTPDMYISRSAKLPPDTVERVKELAAQGKSIEFAVKALGISCRQVLIIRKEHKIVTAKPANVEKKPKPKKKRNPMNVLQAWKPPAATTDIEVAVQRLRRKYPVYAEVTSERPGKPPASYTMATRFRVGGMRDVPAERVLEMAGEMERRAA